MKRVMAVDYGDERTGVALSDPTGTLVGEALTIQEWNPERLCQRLAFLASERDADRIVLGLPLNMDGTEGPRAEKARQFGAMLHRSSQLPVVFWDERRSTIEAHAILRTNGKKEKKHRATVDALAASLLLEGYLASGLANVPAINSAIS